MTDWSAFLQLDEFRAYRKKQAEILAAYVEGQSRRLLNSGNSAEVIASLDGAMHMAGLMLDLPERLVKDPGVMENLIQQKHEYIAELSQYLIRRSIIKD